ncbi:MAG: hypothetical protein ACREPL_03760 [Rhodanobacteraceae bacterium]
MNASRIHTPDLRGLPPRDRVRALRRMIRQRFGYAAVGFRYRVKPPRRVVRTSLPALLLAACLAPTATPVHAGTLDLDLNGASIHTEAWARDSLNRHNPGLGITDNFSRRWGVAGGEYLNSYRGPTWYALGEWTPLHVGAADHWHLDAGLAGGLATGDTRAEVPCEPLVSAGVVHVVAPSGVSLCLMIVPNAGPHDAGVVGSQLALPLRTGY